MNGDGSKTPTTPPLPLRGTSPKGGSEGLYEFALDFLNCILRTANPSATLTRGPPPLSGEVKLGSPMGELADLTALRNRQG